MEITRGVDFDRARSGSRESKRCDLPRRKRRGWRDRLNLLNAVISPPPRLLGAGDPAQARDVENTCRCHLRDHVSTRACRRLFDMPQDAARLLLGNSDRISGQRAGMPVNRSVGNGRFMTAAPALDGAMVSQAWKRLWITMHSVWISVDTCGQLPLIGGISPDNACARAVLAADAAWIVTGGFRPSTGSLGSCGKLVPRLSVAIHRATAGESVVFHTIPSP